MAYKAQMKVANDDRWYNNNLLFSTEEEAQQYGRDLFNRWTQTVAYRVVQDEEAPNASFANGKAELWPPRPRDPDEEWSD